MVETIEGILIFVVFALFVALLVGLMKPALVIRWSSNPTRWKVFGWWLSTTIFITILSIVNDTFYTSEERINLIKKDIAKGYYSTAISNINKINPGDVFYDEAQTLLVRADSLQLIAEVEKKPMLKQKYQKKKPKKTALTP